MHSHANIVTGQTTTSVYILGLYPDPPLRVKSLRSRAQGPKFTRKTTCRQAESSAKPSKIIKQQGAAFGGAPRGRALHARPLGVVVFVFLIAFMLILLAGMLFFL